MIFRFEVVQKRIQLFAPASYTILGRSNTWPVAQVLYTSTCAKAEGSRRCPSFESQARAHLFSHTFQFTAYLCKVPQPLGPPLTKYLGTFI